MDEYRKKRTPYEVLNMRKHFQRILRTSGDKTNAEQTCNGYGRTFNVYEQTSNEQ